MHSTLPKTPTKAPKAPDISPKTSPQNREASVKSRISQVDDPLISGDTGKRERGNTDEAAVDEAGQIRKKQPPVDLLH